MKRKLIIAIDGPAGAGKSTIARATAKKLNYLYIDTGAMYRAVAWKALQKKINLNNPKSLEALTKKTGIELKQDKKKDLLRVFVDGRDITGKIRSEEISRAAHRVAVFEDVRRVLREKQRAIGRKGGVVMEGRDIGTAVFPDADLKIFLNASLRARARRRYEEFKARGKNVTLALVSRSISHRDYGDVHREASPLRRAKDAVVINSTRLNIEEVVEKILEQVR